MAKFTFSIRSISFREAFLFAILFHIVLLLIIEINPVVILPITKDAQANAFEQQEPIKFTFVDVPDDKAATERPDANRFSDKNRLARGKAPEVNPESESRLPYSIGDTKEFTQGTPPPPENVREMVSPSPKAESESSEKEEAPPLSAQPSTGDRIVAKPSKEIKPEIGEGSLAQKQKAVRESLMNLDKYLDSRTFDNRDSGVSTDGFLSFDTKDFDFGPYAQLLYRIVKSNWIVPYAATHLGMKGVTVISFRIRKDGRVMELTLEQSSGIRPFDAAALNAIDLSNPLPPLPKEFPKESVGVRFGFFYNVQPPDN